MLTKEDLQAISEIMDDRITSAITASEKRMSAAIADAVSASESRMSDRIDSAIAASESRMSEKIAASESRMSDRISASENRIFAYIEANVESKLNLLAEGHQMLLETLAPKSRVEELENEVSFLKNAFNILAEKVSGLEKAV